MAYKVIPTNTNSLNYEFAINLDGTVFILHFYFNNKLTHWFMDIRDSNSNNLVNGVALLLGSQLLARFVIEGLPIGDMFMLNIDGYSVEANDVNFGTNVLLIYREAGTA